jgi:peptide/nickel transport system substrate-binding protein
VNLTLRTNGDNSNRVAICELLARELRAAGISVECVFEPFPALVTRFVSSYDWELALVGFSGGIDPTNQEEIFLSSGSQHVIEPGQEYPRREWEAYVDSAWREAVETIDEETKKRALQMIQRVWIEEVPWVYTYSPAVVHVFKRKWGNIFPRSSKRYGLTAILARTYDRSRE